MKTGRKKLQRAVLRRKRTSGSQAKAPALNMPLAGNRRTDSKAANPCLKMNFDEILKDSVRRCRQAAKAGQEVSAQAVATLNEAVGEMRSALMRVTSGTGKFKGLSDGTRGELHEKLSEICNELTGLVQDAEATSEKCARRKDDFRVVLLGRTEAGKSTLKELLTNGSGKTIGAGGQRTTRCASAFSWKGISILDVPGVSAVGGEADSEIAMKEAREADLVLYIMTNAAQQDDELSRYVELRMQGKTLLCVKNFHRVVLATSIESNPTLKDLSAKGKRELVAEDLHGTAASMDADKEHVAAFRKMVGERLNGEIPEVTVVHLWLEWLSRLPAYKTYAVDFRQVGRFAELEASLVSAIQKNGPFLRYKNCCESVVRDMTDAAYLLQESANLYQDKGTAVAEKVQLLTSWSEEFEAKGFSRIQEAVQSLRSATESELSAFVEKHYDDKDALKTWCKHVEGMSALTEVSHVVGNLDQESQNKISDVLEALRREFAFFDSFESSKQYDPGDRANSRRIWNRVVVGIGICFGIAALCASGGWVGGGICVGGAIITGALRWAGKFFESKADKIANAKKRLTELLKKENERVIKNVKENAEKTFKEKILASVQNALEALTASGNVCDCLGETAHDLAVRIFNLLDRINTNLVRHYFEDGGRCRSAGILHVARIPGEMFLIRFAGKSWSKDRFRSLGKLLQERSASMVAGGGVSESQLKACLGSAEGRTAAKRLSDNIKKLLFQVQLWEECNEES